MLSFIKEFFVGILLAVGIISPPVSPSLELDVPVLESTTVMQEMPVEKSSSQEKETLSSTVQASVVRPLPAPTSIAPTVSTISSQSTTQSQKEGLQIEGHSTEIKNDTAFITWKTTLPSRSRLILQGMEGNIVYESENGIGLEHSVRISNLIKETVYPYHITARSVAENLEDDLYSSFETEMKYIAYIKENLVNQEDRCYTFVVRDSAGRLKPNYEISRSGLNSGSKCSPIGSVI